MVCALTQIRRFMRLIFSYYFFILWAELFIICRRSFFPEVRFNRWMPMNAIFIWKRDCRMGYVRILATIRNIKTLISCAMLPFRFPFKCWPQIRKNPQRNYYRTTLEGERRVLEPCNPSMYNPWMYIHVKWGCQSLKAYKRVTFDSLDFLNVELENLFARRSYWQSHRKFCLLHCLPQKKIIKRRSIHLLGCFIKLSAYRLYLLTTKNPTATTATERKKQQRTRFQKFVALHLVAKAAEFGVITQPPHLREKKNSCAHHLLQTILQTTEKTLRHNTTANHHWNG